MTTIAISKINHQALKKLRRAKENGDLESLDSVVTRLLEAYTRMYTIG